MAETGPLHTRVRDYLLERLLPFALEHFPDTSHGGFHERLNRTGRALDVGCKRLLVQCRQIYFFSQAYLLTGLPSCLEHARAGFEFLRSAYRDPEEGGWFFATTPDGQPLDRRKDLYAHAFVLFALAHLARAAGDTLVRGEIDHTIEMLEQHLAHPAGGFAEAAAAGWETPGAVRRQNPHMHLLEAFLALQEWQPGARHRTHADALYELFVHHFYDTDTETLGEYFTEEWQRDPERGHIVEPGHHFEWVWLLHRAARFLHRPDAREHAAALHEWAFRHGLDREHGGLFDEVDRAGAPVTDSKRIWPVTECIQACAVRFHDLESPRDAERLRDMIDFLFAHYLHDDGTWNEHLDRQLQPLHDELPCTTPYHLMLALSETLGALEPT